MFDSFFAQPFDGGRDQLPRSGAGRAERGRRVAVRTTLGISSKAASSTGTRQSTVSPCDPTNSSGWPWRKAIKASGRACTQSAPPASHNDGNERSRPPEGIGSKKAGAIACSCVFARQPALRLLSIPRSISECRLWTGLGFGSDLPVWRPRTPLPRSQARPEKAARNSVCDACHRKHGCKSDDPEPYAAHHRGE